MESVGDIYWGYVWDKISHITWRGGATSDQTLAISGLISYTFPTFIRPNHFLHHHCTPDNCHPPLIADDDLTNNVLAWSSPPPAAWSCYLLSWWMSRSRPDCCHHTFTDRHSPQSISASCWQDSEIYRVNTLRFNIGILDMYVLLYSFQNKNRRNQQIMLGF